MTGLFVASSLNPWTRSAFTVLCLLCVIVALRHEWRQHPYGPILTRLAVAAGSALTIAYTYVVIQDGVYYNCETLWWTLECWLWA